MHYLDEGSGEPILMLHGNPTWSFYYRNLVKDLSADGFRCIAPDHIGCGFSSKPQEYSYTLAQHIENLEALVKNLDLTGITLVLHDWGGAIGMGFATRQPEKIKRIIILNTGAFLSKEIPWQINICRIPVFGAAVIRGLNGFALPATRMATTRAGGLPPEVARGFLWPYRTWHDRVANLRFVQDIPMKPDHRSFATLAEIESKLPLFRKTPSMICWGGKDFCFNDHFLDRWKAEFPGAAVHRFADAGHYVLEDAYEEILPLARSFCRESKADQEKRVNRR
ncbi:MAG: alpha/beta fold hydrolase [Opitutales bacterium]